MPMLTSILRKIPQKPRETFQEPHGRIVRVVESPNAYLYIYECEPMRQRVLWKSRWVWEHAKANPEKPVYESFIVQIPWSYFMVRMNRKMAVTYAFIFVSPERLQSDEDEIFMPPLPNIFPSGAICTGTIQVRSDDAPEKKVADLFKAFWTTPFTSDTMTRESRMIPNALRIWGANRRLRKSILPAWEAATVAETPLDWKHFRIRVMGCLYVVETLADAITFALRFREVREGGLTHG